MAQEQQPNKPSKPPSFELKPEDAIAPLAIVEWIRQALEVNLSCLSTCEDLDVPPARIAGACRRLADILDYQDDAGQRMPD